MPGMLPTLPRALVNRLKTVVLPQFGLSCLEGGYDLEALAACAVAHVNVLKEQTNG